MIALVLALALLQPDASAAPSPAPTAAPSDAASAPAPVMPGRINPGGPMMPIPGRRMPNAALHVNSDDVVIRNSGSTNIGGYEIVIHPDDSAEVAVDGTVSQKTVDAPQAKWLRARIADAPLDQIAGGRCMKSASFGSSTTVAANGVTSPDLSCPGDSPQARELARTIGVIVGQLNVSPAVGRRLLHPL